MTAVHRDKVIENLLSAVVSGTDGRRRAAVFGPLIWVVIYGVLQLGTPQLAAAQPIDAPIDGEPVSVAELMAYAEENAPALLAAQSLTPQVNTAQVYAAAGNLNDLDLDVGLGATRSGDSTGVAGSISLTRTLEVHGQQGLRDALATRLEEEVDLRISSAWWDLHTDVHTLYVEAIADRRRWEVSLGLVEFAETVRDVVMRRVAAGEDALLQQSLAETDVSLARQTALDARSAYLRTLNDLAVAVGWERAMLPIPAAASTPPQPAPELDELLRIARDSRVDLQTWSSYLTRLQAELELSEQESRVNPTIGGEYEFDVFGGFNEHRALLLFSIPFRSRARQRVYETDSARQFAEASLLADAAIASVHAEIRAARDSLQSSYERTQFFEEELMPHWEGNLAMLRRALEVGELDLLGVLYAEGRLLEQQLNAIEAVRDYFAALAELERAVGTEVMP